MNTTPFTAERIQHPGQAWANSTTAHPVANSIANPASLETWPSDFDAPDATTQSVPLGDIMAATRRLLAVWDRAVSNRAPGTGLLRDGSLPRGWADLDPAPAHTHAPQRISAQPEGATASGLVVQMLDGFQIWIGARQVGEIPRGKTRSLLKFLLLNRRRPVPRARLLSLFWPEADAAAARNSLNVTLHRLRKALGDPALLVYANDSYQLQTAGTTWIDTEQFAGHADEGQIAHAQGQHALAIRHFETAAALYCTDLLDDGERESALQAEAQSLRDRHNQVLERLATLHEAAGDHHACLRTALRHLQLDGCNEAAHRRLMRCYARLGQLQLAERQYRSCISTLRAQLGLSPDEGTTALYRQIARREAV